MMKKGISVKMPILEIIAIAKLLKRKTILIAKT